MTGTTIRTVGQEPDHGNERADRALRRRVERHGAAAVRAVAGRSDVEWRSQRLHVAGRVVPIATPYVVGDLGDTPGSIDEARWRGVADALGLLVRHSDLELHRVLSPAPLLERIVFDALEQLRCDSLAPSHLRGQRSNLRAAFDAWSLEARAHRVDESRTSLLVFTVIHMAHARLMGRSMPEAVEDLTEATRFHLAPVIGHALRQLPRARHDQRRHAAAALEIARLVADVAGDIDEAEIAASATRHRLVVPAEWTLDDAAAIIPTATDAAPNGDGSRSTSNADRELSLADVGDYRVYTRAHDRVVLGAALYREAKLHAARVDLDRLVQAQAVSAPRLAARMLELFGSWSDDDWSFARDHGVLDGRRLSQLVANPTGHELFKQRRVARTSHSAVTFLLDNSGSMKRQRFETVAVLVDTFSRALDLAGVTNEVLGFTTDAWAGGRAVAEWRAAGEPAAPGRMNDVLHIVYKSADDRWRRSRASLAALTIPQHFREGLDGEALAWAHGRLMTRPEPRKVLVMITDGSPTDSATANVNRLNYLDDHLAGVVDRIERHQRATGRGVELGSINIDASTTPSAFRRSIDLDLVGTLTLAHYAALDRLCT